MSLRYKKERRKVWFRKKIFEEINERIINETESWFFENISKIDKHFNQIDKKIKIKKRLRHKSEAKTPISGMKWMASLLMILKFK